MHSSAKLLTEIGSRLERLRIINGYSSYEVFASAHQISRMQYWRIEKGKTNLTIKSLVRILEIHRISVDRFFAKSFYRDFPEPAAARKVRKRAALVRI